MDRREIIRSLFPKYLQENQEYSIFIDMTAEELGLVADYIELFSEIGIIELTPDVFVKYLADLVGFDYSDSLDIELQREAIKRIFTAYEQRGTEASILKAADYANSPDWVAGDIFLTKKDIPERYASVVYPVRQLFRLSISPLSGPDRMPDRDTWRDGVLIIKLKNYTERVEKALRAVIPAGIKYYIEEVV